MCAGSPRQWCSWGPYKFRVFQHHTRTPKRPYRNYGSGRRSFNKMFAKHAKPHSTHPKNQNATAIELLNWIILKIEIKNKTNRRITSRNYPNTAPFFWAGVTTQFFTMGKPKFKNQIFKFIWYYKLLVTLINYQLYINSLLITIT